MLTKSVHGDSASDSDDDSLSSDEDNETLAVPVEIKSRLAHSSFHAERHNLEALEGLRAYEAGDPVYTQVNHNELYHWIPMQSESFQLLHHVAVQNVRLGLILVGSNKNVMFGVFVRYDDAIIEAYRRVLDNLYQRALSFAYGPTSEIPLQRIKLILESDKMKSLGISLHAFQTAYYVWRKIRLKDNVRLPLPPVNAFFRTRMPIGTATRVHPTQIRSSAGTI